jgi:hypothetical protein
MISSNSDIDFIQLARASGIDPDAIINTPDFAEWLRDYLSESKITVTFTKKDGTDRKMLCTRNFSVIPEDKHPKGGSTQPATKTDAVQVFDLEINEWRSFNTSNIKRIEWDNQ